MFTDKMDEHFSKQLTDTSSLGKSYETIIHINIVLTKKAVQLEVQKNEAVSRCLNSINAILFILDRIAHCTFGCRQGDHIHEQLLAKYCNFTNSSILLSEAGLYDQSYANYRSMTEILNLSVLFWFSKEELEKYKSLSTKKRRDLYRPSNVRKKLEEVGATTSITADEYGHLSGVGIHPDPTIGANSHNLTKASYARPKYQEFAFIRIMNRLGYASSIMASINSDLVHIPTDVRKALVSLNKDLADEILPSLRRHLAQLNKNESDSC